MMKKFSTKLDKYGAFAVEGKEIEGTLKDAEQRLNEVMRSIRVAKTKLRDIDRYEGEPSNARTVEKLEDFAYELDKWFDRTPKL